MSVDSLRSRFDCESPSWKLVQLDPPLTYIQAFFDQFRMFRLFRSQYFKSVVSWIDIVYRRLLDVCDDRVTRRPFLAGILTLVEFAERLFLLRQLRLHRDFFEAFDVTLPDGSVNVMLPEQEFTAPEKMGPDCTCYQDSCGLLSSRVQSN